MHNVALVYCIKNLISKILFILKISPNKFSPFSPSITILWSAKKKKKKKKKKTWNWLLVDTCCSCGIVCGIVVSPKVCVGFSIFDSFWFLWKFYFCSTKCMDSLILKRLNSFENQNNIKAKHSFAPRPLIFKLQKEALKFNDIYVSWKIWPRDNFFKLRKSTFWKRQFFSIADTDF